MGEAEDKWLDKDCWRNKSRLYRYFAMLMLCTIGFGTFLAYDSLGALQESIMTTLDLNNQGYSHLYSIGSWPTVFLCFFGGYLIDKVFGVKLGTLIYAALTFVGHLIFALGTLLGVYWYSLVGRFFFGMGTEFINISLQYYSVIYFKGKELSMVICLIVSTSKLGSSAMFEMAAPLLASVRTQHAGSEDVGVVIFIVGSFTIVTVVCSLVLFFMDPKETDKDQKQQATTQVKLSDVVNFDCTFWLAVIAASFNTTYIPFPQAFFTEKYGMTVEEANSIYSLFILMGAAFAPLVGIIVDRTGREISIACLGLAIGFVSHLILAFTAVTPYFPMFLLAISFGFMTSSLTPVFAYIVPEKMLGTAYGINQAAMNLLYSGSYIIGGIIVDIYGYHALEKFVSVNAFVALISSLILWFLDYRKHGNLNWSSAKRRRQEQIDLRLNED